MNQLTHPVVNRAALNTPAKDVQHVFLLKRFAIVVLTLVLLLLAGWKAILMAGDALIDETKLATFESYYSAQAGGKIAASAAKGKYVYAREMPDYIRNAFVAIEDHRFAKHSGVDLVALGRAVWIDFSQGGKFQGGSTITMQLARNLFLSSEKTISRKVKEILIAVNLEHRFTKEQLLEMYVNTIYFGHGKYGIEEAANWYFGKTIRANDPNMQMVSIGEAAILASLPKAPESYSPVKNMVKAKDRQKIVLERMEELHYVTAEEKEAALQERTWIVAHNKQGLARSS